MKTKLQVLDNYELTRVQAGGAPMMNMMAAPTAEEGGGATRPGNPNVKVGDDEDG